MSKSKGTLKKEIYLLAKENQQLKKDLICRSDLFFKIIEENKELKNKKGII